MRITAAAQGCDRGAVRLLLAFCVIAVSSSVARSQLLGPAEPPPEDLPPVLCQVRDAHDKPIASAQLTLLQGPSEDNVKPSLQLTSDGNGNVTFPDSLTRGHLAARLTHDDYGAAGAVIEPVASGVVRLTVPLVKRNSEPFARGAFGVVSGPDGKPVPNATVRCTEVRTPGGGLISYHGQGYAITDANGAFALYVPTKGDRRENERGDLIPPGSTFHLQVEARDDSTLFPCFAPHRNGEEARVQLERPQRAYRFRYAMPDGAMLADDPAAGFVYLRYVAEKGDRQTSLPSRYRAGGLLPPGKYIASYSSPDGRQRMEFVPMELRADSPPEMVFRLPPTLTLRGRIIDGITGKPAADAYALAMNSSSYNNLAALDDDAWEALRTGDVARAQLDRFYGFTACVRTGDDGAFAIAQPPGDEVYAIVAFAKDRLPFMQRHYKHKPDDKNVIALPDIPLFPAAKVIVTPMFDGGERPSLSPRWVFEDAGQPEWFERFKKAANMQDRDFAYVHWMKFNEAQPIHIPAGVRLKLRFDTPYEDQWVTRLAEPDRVLELKPGETTDVGVLNFAPALAVAVRVTDETGKPIEGIPIRRMYDNGRPVWSVAHNTDAAGLAHFHAPPKSKVHFSVDYPRTKGQKKPENLTTIAELSDTPPADGSITLKLTAEQIEQALGERSPK